MELLSSVEDLKVGDIVKAKAEIFNGVEVVFRVVGIKGYVFGVLLNTDRVGDEMAFRLDNKIFYRLTESEAMLYARL